MEAEITKLFVPGMENNNISFLLQATLSFPRASSEEPNKLEANNAEV